MEDSERLAHFVLSKWGFGVAPIGQCDQKRADFRVTDSESEYLVEVKDKSESDTVTEEREECLERGEIFPQREKLTHDNRIRGVLRAARDQLDATPKDCEPTYQVIWFHSSGYSAGTKWEQAFATFYGHVHLFPTPFQATARQTQCFYFDFNAARDMPSVVAMVQTKVERDDICIRLCLNEFATYARKFRSSRLYSEFHSRDCAVDPEVWETDGKAIRFQSEVSRKNDNEICQALQQQTGISYKPIRFTRHSAMSAVRY
jgi:hypothetical protein